mmetsp:Transcript_56260/g.115063  ORF Transcript_56260/g.115063 Transcript_56260/m.115063 type:complete len:113 (-) Transcript_56260:33-371(-)
MLAVVNANHMPAASRLQGSGSKRTIPERSPNKTSAMSSADGRLSPNPRLCSNKADAMVKVPSTTAKEAPTVLAVSIRDMAKSQICTSDDDEYYLSQGESGGAEWFRLEESHE